MYTDDHGTLHESRREHSVEEKLDMILAELKDMRHAFPRTEDGEVDFVGHRSAHEAMIRSAQAQTEFWQELKLDVAKKGVIGLLAVIVGLILAGIGIKTGVI